MTRSLAAILLVLARCLLHPSVSAMATTPVKKKTVLVTGANGYLASHVVKQLLERGHDVRACVRDASNAAAVDHLLALPSSSSTAGALELFTTGDIGDATLKGRYDAPLRGCDAVIHAATPLRPKFRGAEFDGVRDMLDPGMAGTKEILDSVERCPSVKCLVLTSSMSAAAPVPEPDVKDERHWSDDDAQLARGNYYGCLKTRQERLCREWSEAHEDVRYAAINPTMILGPPVGAHVRDGFSYAPSGTMGSLHGWITGGQTTAPNDSMSFVHVRDCAAMHVAAVEGDDVSGRYFSLVESLHWNELLGMLEEMHPGIVLETPYEYEGSDKITPTRFNLDRMNSLGVKVASIREILAESIQFFKDVGAL